MLRVPFRAGQRRQYANNWSVSAMVRFGLGKLPVLSTGGWDQYSAMNDGDDQAQIVMNGDGILGAHNIFGSVTAAAVAAVSAARGTRRGARVVRHLRLRRRCGGRAARIHGRVLHGRSPSAATASTHSRGASRSSLGRSSDQGEIHLRQLTVPAAR